MRDLTSNLERVSQPGKSTRINPFALSRLFDSDLKNYLLYWGESGETNENPILWMISSKVVSINESQVRKTLRKCSSFDGRYTKCICRHFTVIRSPQTIQFKLQYIIKSIE